MNNFKKIGMTALAASLVSTSVFAGEMTVTGSASMAMEGHSKGSELNEGTSFSMGNQLTFTGGGELDNGLTVSLSFILDQGDDGPATNTLTTLDGRGDSSPFDSHSVSISSDALGTLVLHGEGGGSAASALDTTAAGDMWDNFNSNGGVSVSDSAPGDNSIMYTLPSLVDGLSVSASYNPQVASGALDTSAGNETELGYSATYTGVEGLSLSYGKTDLERVGSTVAKGEQTAWRASYAYGPVTVAATNSDYDIAGTGSDQETSSYKISYTVSDAISIGYGTEEISKVGSVDAEYDGFSASYTAGGMTISANMQDGKNIAHATGAAGQVEYWGLGLSFAF
ncbi:porin [Candidatus Pelagibacter ubique]|nr:porin [Candidatus Pelagibacter ubique]